MDMSGRRVLVTGASSGIGRETAILLSQLGALVTLTGRDEARLAETRDALTGAGHEVAAFDLSRLDEIPAFVKSLAAAGGGFAGLVHCAGVHSLLPLQFLRSEAMENMLRINVTTAMLLAKAVRQKTCRDESGCSIVLLASVAALAGEPALAAYSASKAAIIGLARALAVELAPERIRVNAVSPGFVPTAMTERVTADLTAAQLAAITAKHPLGAGTARDVANAVCFLLGDSGRWITGTNLVVDGGYTAHS